MVAPFLMEIRLDRIFWQKLEVNESLTLRDITPLTQDALSKMAFTIAIKSSNIWHKNQLLQQTIVQIVNRL